MRKETLHVYPYKGNKDAILCPYHVFFSFGLKYHTFIGLNMTRDCRILVYLYVRLVRINIRQFADASPTQFDISLYLVQKSSSVSS